MSDASQSGPSTPAASTPATSSPPSPSLDALNLRDVSDEAKAAAAKIKAEANKAFVGAHSLPPAASVLSG